MHFARLTFLVISISAAMTGGCKQFPALDHTITPELKNADYPDLGPLSDVMAGRQQTKTPPDAEQQRMKARVAALRARAARLKRGVLTGPEHVRLREGLR